jgi:adenine-specific DNA glycosylase
VYTDENWLADVLVKYNGAESEHGMYKFKHIEHVSTERLASATNLRSAVRSGNRKEFYSDMGVSPSVTIEVDGKDRPIFDVVAYYLNQYPEKVKKAVKAKEDAAGVGIITKQNTTVDVNKNTPKKNLRAFRLAEQIKEMEKELQENKGSKFKNIMNHSGMEARRYDQLDQYYGMYRLGLAMASQGKSDGLGVTQDHPAVWIRNSVEADILSKAEKDLGLKPTRLIPSGPSEEITSINKASPVAKPKRNQYGV